jgi:hypothetical protein
MAANKKAPITVALQNDGSPYSLHHDLAGDFRMDRAVVGIRSCLGERVREFSSVSITLDLVVPTGTVIACGPKTKLSIFTATSAAEGWSVAVTRDDPANSSNNAIITGIITTAIHTFFSRQLCVSFPGLILLLGLFRSDKSFSNLMAAPSEFRRLSVTSLSTAPAVSISLRRAN